MSSYSRVVAAERAGVPPDFLDRVVELGIVRPEAPDRFSPGDVRRAQMARSFVDAGVALEGLSALIRRGDLSLDFMDAASYERFAHLAEESFGQVSERTGIPLSTLAKVEHDRLTLTYDKLLQLSQRLNLRMSDLFSEADAAGDSPITARRSIGRLADAVRVNTPNYEYFYMCPELRRKRMVPTVTRVRARSIASTPITASWARRQTPTACSRQHRWKHSAPARAATSTATSCALTCRS